MRISDWSSDVCSSDLNRLGGANVKSVRGALDFDRGGAFTSTLVADWLKQKTTGPAPHVLDNGDPAWDLLPDEVKTDVRKAAVPFDPFARTESYGGTSEEHTSELQSLMRISYAVFCLKKKNNHT